MLSISYVQGLVPNSGFADSEERCSKVTTNGSVHSVFLRYRPCFCPTVIYWAIAMLCQRHKGKVEWVPAYKDLTVQS